MLGLRTALVSAVVVLPLAAHSASKSDVEVAFELRDLLVSRSMGEGGETTPLSRFYATRQGAAAWWAEGGWLPAARAAVRELASSEEHGLVPADYHAGKLERIVLGRSEAIAPRGVAEAELLLTAAVLRYLEDVANGRVDPEAIGWNVNPTRRMDPPSALQRGLHKDSFASWIDDVGPASERYRRLRAARKRYTKLAKVDWPFVPDGPTVEPGDRDPRVPLIRRQLGILEEFRAGAQAVAGQKTGPSPGVITLVSYDVAGGSAGSVSSSSGRAGRGGSRNPELYDEELQAAVRRFQNRHGLRVDGKVGPVTRAALNISPKQRLEEIDLNLERLRWISDHPADRYVMVNIPGYRLTVHAGGSVVQRMKVVVGQPDWKTPIFSDYIVNLKFAPTWTIPTSIVEEETLPKLREDPGYLRRNGIRVFSGWGPGAPEVNPYTVDWYAASSTSYVFRQEPGPGNALGRLRFSLTNAMGIYLHDTPAKRYFERSIRALSHGCVRVANPLGLAAFLLEPEPSWNRDRIERAMQASDTHFHNLEQPTPVHFVYFTAMVDDEGRVQFRDDVYDRNRRLREALARARSRRERLT